MRELHYQDLCHAAKYVFQCFAAADQIVRGEVTDRDESEGISDFGDVSDIDEHEAPREDKDHEEDAGQSKHPDLQQDSLAAVPVPDPITDKGTIWAFTTASTASSLSSDSSSSSGSETAESSSSRVNALAPPDSFAEDHAAAALTDVSARPVQPTMSSAADVDGSNSDMQPGLSKHAEVTSALQTDFSIVAEAQQASMLYPDDPACEPRHINDIAAAKLDEGAAASHARSVSVVLLYGCKYTSHCVEARLLSAGIAGVLLHTCVRHTLPF